MGNLKKFAFGFIVFALLGIIYPSAVFADTTNGNTMVAFNSTYYGSDGYDYHGYDRNGYDRNGYDRNGRDKYGYDRNGRDKYGYNRNGYDRQGFDRYGWDINGRDRNGCDRDGYDRDGYDRYGWHRNGQDRNGHDRNSTSSFSIQKDSSFDVHGNLDFLRVDIDTTFPIYVFLTNHQSTQVLTASQDIELDVTLIAPDGKKFVQNDLVIEQGNTYATMEISGAYRGLWTVQVTGNPGFDPDTGNNGNNGNSNHSNDNNGDGNGNNGKNGNNGDNGNSNHSNDNNGDGNGNNGNNGNGNNGSSNHSNDNNGDGNGNNGNNANNGNNGNSNHSNDNNGDGNGNNGNKGNNGKQIVTVSGYFWVNKAPSSTGLLVTPETATVIKDGTQQFKATYKWHIRFLFIFEINYDFDLTNYVTWSSSDPCASIDSNGLARGINSGTATITAYKDWNWIANLLGLIDQSDTATLTVVDDKTLTGLSITPASATIPANGTIQYSAELVYSDNSTQAIANVSWASSDTQVAPIDATGLVTGKGGSRNLIAITATYTDNNGVIYNGTSNLSVLPIFSIIPESATMLPNDTLQFNAQLVYYDGTQTDVTSSTVWSSSNDQLMTIDSNGLAASIGGGECSVTANYLDSSGNNYSVTTMLSILPLLKVTPSAPLIAAGDSLQFSAQLQYGDGTLKDITDLTWISTNPEVATIDASGNATGIAGGSSLITVEDPVTKVTGKTELSVLPEIVITPSQATIAEGAEQQFNAQLLYANEIMTDVTDTVNWKSSKTSVASIDGSGKALGKEAGTSNITATVTNQETELNTSATLTVTTVLPTISINPVTATISPGEDLQFSAQLLYPNRDPQDITNDAIWSSSNDKVATIDASGNATGIGGGTCTITVTDPETEATGTITIIVRSILSISPSVISIAPGDTYQFTAELIYADNVKTDVTNRVTWTTSNFGIATMGIDGKVTGHGGGFCTITARDSLTELSTTAVLTVLPEMRITPSMATISIGTSQQFSAQLVYHDGSVTEISENITWLSSDSDVAMIDESGRATGVSPGTCIITVTNISTGISSTTILTVLQPKLSIIPESTTIHLGSTKQYSAYLIYADGTPSLDVTDRVNWTSSNSDIVTIAFNGGLATGRVAGTSMITANDSASNSTHSVTIAVTDAMNLIVEPIPPSTTAIFVGDKQQFSAKLIFADGSTSDVTSSVSAWASSAPSVASINNSGLVTGNGKGISSISAIVEFNGKQYIDTCSLDVFPLEEGVISEWER